MTEDKDSLLEQMRKGRQTFEAIICNFPIIENFIILMRFVFMKEKMENIIILEFAKYLGVILLHIL